MTLLVLSDSHGRSDNVEKIISLAGKPEAILFLGDGLRDLSYLSTDIPIYKVRGNCDYFNASHIHATEERILHFGEYTVMMMHGHAHSVKDSPEHAMVYAAQKGADILLYGHTHVRHEQYLPTGSTIRGVTLEKPLWVLNPGSVGDPFQNGYSFGTVTIRGKEVLLGFGTIEN